MQRINEDLRSGQFKQAYLLYGEEAYLRRQYRDRLKKALLGDGDAMNMNCFEGKDVNVGEVIDVAETMPFFADRRVIVMDGTGLFKSGGEKLAEYMARARSGRLWASSMRKSQSPEASKKRRSLTTGSNR